MAIGIGQSAYIGVGEEVAYGAAVARTRFLLHNTESVKVNEARLESGALYRVGRHGSQYAQGMVDVGGDFTWHPRFSSHAWMIILKHLLGSMASAQPDAVGAPTVWAHTFTPADALPLGLSVEVVKDVLAHLFVGCKVARLSLNFTTGNLLEASVSLIGKEQTSIAKTALAYTEGNLIVLTSATMTWDGGAQNVLQGSLQIENALAPIHYMNSRFTAEPQRTGKRKITGGFQVHLEDATLYTAFRAATNKALVLTFTGNAIAGGQSFELKITCPVSFLTDAVAPAATEGPLVIPCTFESFMNDGNASEITIKLTNEHAAV